MGAGVEIIEKKIKKKYGKLLKKYLKIFLLATEDY